MARRNSLTIGRLRAAIAGLSAEIEHLATVALPEADRERLALTKSIASTASEIVSLADTCAVLCRRPGLL